MDLSYYLQVLFTLAVLVGVLFLIAKLGSGVRDRKYTGEIKLLDRMALNQHVSLCIVRVKDRQYLMSLGGKEVRVLETIE